VSQSSFANILDTTDSVNIISGFSTFLCPASCLEHEFFFSLHILLLSDFNHFTLVR